VSLTTDEINKLLMLMNTERQSVGANAVNMSLLQWNWDLASMAEAYADTCPGAVVQPSDERQNLFNFSYIGQIARGGPTMQTPDMFVSQILAQAQYYRYTTATCNTGAVCGRCLRTCAQYTQLIWATTTDVGCAKKFCSDLPLKFYWICNFGEGGNTINMAPYVKGWPSTSGCQYPPAHTGSN
jgi:pathogenesis-related protein 1